MTKTVVGLFDRFEDAQGVVRELADSGFSKEDISLVSRDADGSYSRFFEDKSTDISDSAAAGAGIGAVLGSLGGLLIGLGALSIPGIGPVLAAGPLVSALAGAGIGALTGGLVGALVDLGIPDQQAELYSEGIRRGGSLVVVHADDRKADLAMMIMNRHDPVDLDSRAELWSSESIAGARRVEEPGEALLDYGDLDEDLHQQDNLDRRLHVEDESIQTTGDSRFDRDRTSVPGTGDPRIDRSNDVVERDGSTIPLTGATQDNPFVKEGGFDTPDYATESALNAQDDVWRAHFHDQLDTGERYYGYYQPAYRFGYEIASDSNFETYRHYEWDQFEAAAQAEWVSRGLPGAWEDVKAAVRFAWEQARR